MTNIHEHNFALSRNDKESLTKQKAKALWLFGLSGSGKSTISNELELLFYNKQKIVARLDGDNLRSGINRDLGFSEEDRKKNLERVAYIAKLFLENGISVLCSFITPLASQREEIREILKDDVIFILINTTIDECKRRDPKGLYKKALSGEIKNFTGIDSKFEGAAEAGFTIDTSKKSAKDCALEIYNFYSELQTLEL
jgi:adenylylsulfate kinase